MTKIPNQADIVADALARQITARADENRERESRFAEKYPKVLANLVKRITTCTAGYFLFHKFYEPLSQADKHEFCKILISHGYRYETVIEGGKHKVRVWIDVASYSCDGDY